MRFGIIANLKRPQAGGTVAEMVAWCLTRRHQLCLTPEVAAQVSPVTKIQIAENPAVHADILISLGGDGTLLSSVRLAAPYDLPVLGINLGNLGFLTPIPAADWPSAMEQVESGEYGVTERMLLAATVSGAAAHEITLPTALNDVVIHHGDVSRVISLALYANGQEVGAFTADGLILATATGSTAYNLAVGGPIVHPEIDAIIAAPISPFSLTMRPLIFPPATELTCRVLTTGRNAAVTVDGQVMRPLEDGESVTIRRASGRAKLITLQPVSFYDILRRKLNWSVPPRP